MSCSSSGNLSIPVCERPSDQLQVGLQNWWRKDWRMDRMMNWLIERIRNSHRIASSASLVEEFFFVNYTPKPFEENRT